MWTVSKTFYLRLPKQGDARSETRQVGSCSGCHGGDGGDRCSRYGSGRRLLVDLEHMERLGARLRRIEATRTSLAQALWLVLKGI